MKLSKYTTLHALRVAGFLGTFHKQVVSDKVGTMDVTAHTNPDVLDEIHVSTQITKPGAAVTEAVVINIMEFSTATESGNYIKGLIGEADDSLVTATSTSLT